MSTGIPLAIELAAARLSMLSLDQIAARINQRFRLLTGGSRTAVRRQQTLQATIDWSYQLLDEEERGLVRRLAVFAGGWSLEAVEALGADVVPPYVDVFELLSRLVAKSMVLVEVSSNMEPSVVRYRFLETIREYAEVKLVEAAEADLARTRHRDWYLSLAEQALNGMEAVDQKYWWARLELEHDNLRVALSWSAADPGDRQALLRLAGLLGRFWQDRIYHRGDRLVGDGISTERGGSQFRARAPTARGKCYASAGGWESTRALNGIAAPQPRRGDPWRSSAARRLIEEAFTVSREEGCKREIAWNLNVLGQTLGNAGDLEAVEPLLLESSAVGRQSGDVTAVLVSTEALAQLCLKRGDIARARRAVREKMTVARQLDLKSAIAHHLVMLGDLASAERDWETAEDWYRQALRATSNQTPRPVVARALRHYAGMRAAGGDARGAVRFFGATSPVHDFPFPMFSSQDAEQDEIVAAARVALGEDDFKLAWAEGQSITLEQASAEILSEMPTNT